MVRRSRYDEVLNQLGRQQHRRSLGAPVVSVLIGPAEVTIGLWRQWLARSARIDISCQSTALEMIARQWVAELTRERDLLFDVLSFLVERSGRADDTSAELHRRLVRGDQERRELFFDSMRLNGVRPESVAIAELLIMRSMHGEDDRPELPELPELVDALDATLARFEGVRWASMVAELAAMVPTRTIPGLMLYAEGRNTETWLIEATRAAVKLAKMSPQLPIAVACEPRAASAYFAHATESDRVALMREGALHVPVDDVLSLEEHLAHAGISHAHELHASMRRMITDGVTDELIEAFCTAARHISSKAPDEQAVGCAAAERFLFARLQSLAETAGFFARHEQRALMLGSTAVEVSLVAPPLKLVIVVDANIGDPAVYRRARRTDLLLQKHDYLVVRCLARDVVEHLDQVLDVIIEAVAFRRQHRSMVRTVAL